MGNKNTSQVRVIRPSDPSDDERGDAQRADDSREHRPKGSMLGPPGIDVEGGESPAPSGRSSLSRPDDNKVGVHLCPTTGTYELEDHLGTRKKLSQEVVQRFKQRNSDTLQGSLAFVPWILQESYFESGLEDGKVVVHRGTGAVVFSDASGFTALTERLAKKSNGAELLSQCLTAFFTPLINLINAYRGDVIKFSGDALTIYFPAVDDTKAPRSRIQVPPHGSYGIPDLGPMATAMLRASACCIEIHKRLNEFDTGVDGVKLCLHIGVGCGNVTILQVGGAVPPETHVPRFEYIIAGPPIEQISIAEPLAKNGETCLSPQAWEYVHECVKEDTRRTLDHEGYHLLLKLDETKYTFPTIKYSAMERDTRHEKQFRMSELNVIRRYIPSAVFKQIEGGTLTYVNEMRNISTIFISGSGVDVSADAGALVAQDLMSSIQRICYLHEGTLNKFVIDDKGMLFLLVFGLPPLVHTDDPTRAVLSCFEMSKAFVKFGLAGRFGITTGRAYCGCCGSAQRMEYTVLGDAVNLSARLMANAPQDGILVDEATKGFCTREVVCEELAPIKVKGKSNPIPIFRPKKRDAATNIGLVSSGGIKFPWYDRPFSMSQQISMTPENMTLHMKENVAQLCSLKSWIGITKVQTWLGGTYSVDLHRRPVMVPKGAQKTEKPGLPRDSPFSSGGVIVIEGATGIGKIELAEHMAVCAATEFNMLPVIGTMGPRVSDMERLGVELLRSTVSAYRHLDPAIPADDLQGVQQLVPAQLQSSMPQVRAAFEGQTDEENRQASLSTLADIAAALLEGLRRKTAIFIVLQLEYGTNLFRKTLDNFKPYWNVVTTLTKLTAQEGGGSGDKPVVMALLVKEADKNHVTVKKALQKGWFVELNPLPEDICTEYICTYLSAPMSMVPQPLLKFITKISLGNPLYVRETVDQLLANQHITLIRNRVGEVEAVQYNEDLEEINIANWSQTAMVGSTVCLLESLDPLQAAVLKMSTCFVGPFSLPDLAASSCSRWAGATHFDYLRLFRAIQDLVELEIIEVPVKSESRSEPAEAGKPAVAAAAKLQMFEMRNVLIRKVGGSMVLEAQKKVVKRQALVERALARHLPARMEALKTKRLEPHIPWYYENVLAKGA